jgi:hypothetical protein
VVVGTTGRFGSAQYRIAPKTVERFMARSAHRSQMESEDVASHSSGSVFEPMSSGTDIYGGWSDSHGGSTTAKLIGIVIPAAIGIALLARKRGRVREELDQVA